jgi:integrative and conjugative element protein (TIGR02256 family)
MTDGQRLAIEQLRDVEDLSAGAFEILAIVEGAGRIEGRVRVDIALRTRGMPRRPEGLPLRNRERLILFIPAGFPFDHPAVQTHHQRFAGFPHVQWTRHLCLYQAPNTEWDASDGMFGFLTRLDEWFRQGAVGELDPTGAPLHPPVAYPTSDRMVIPRADAPIVGEAPWYGLGRLRVISDRRVDVVGWSELFSEEDPGVAAAAILLAAPMPFEFPGTVAGLIKELEDRGVPRQQLLITLQVASTYSGDDSPLYVIVGTPMRGVRDGSPLRPHLSAWFVSPVIANGLRLALEKYSKHDRLREIGEEVEKIIWNWAEEAETNWCVVREQRQEIVRRRDHDAPTAWFRGRSVALWGCGALGGNIAGFLARAGVAKLVLRDRGAVAPGLLVRQPYDDADVGRLKIEALAEQIRAIDSTIDVEGHSRNLLEEPLGTEDCLDRVDLIIDTTGARAVLKKVELIWQREPVRRVSIASLVVGPRAERGLVVLTRPGHSGGPADAVRRAKLAACWDPQLPRWRDDFWPPNGREGAALFQPEPGCSDPTFVGSAADVAVLAGAMLNHLAADLSSQGCSACGHFVIQPHLEDGATRRANLEWQPERVLRDLRAGYEVRLSAGAWEVILDQIEASRRRRGTRVETGGILFGERDDAAGVIWVTEASGPPPDSKASPSGFVCGTVGTQEMNAQLRTRTYGAVQFIGMWHTHPQMTPDPSRIDLGGMAQIVTSLDPPTAKALMLIVGHTPSTPTPAAYVFRRHDIRIVEVSASGTSGETGWWTHGRNLLQGLSLTRRLASTLRARSEKRQAGGRRSK